MESLSPCVDCISFKVARNANSLSNTARDLVILVSKIAKVSIRVGDNKKSVGEKLCNGKLTKACGLGGLVKAHSNEL
jgi:hypothetical protein